MNNNHDSDLEAARYILRLADQGRFHEIIAQMLASAWISTEASAQEMAQDMSQIMGRIVELYDMQGQIWTGLLPGEPHIDPQDEIWHVSFYRGESHLRTAKVVDVESVLNLATMVRSNIEVLFAEDKDDPRDHQGEDWFAWITDGDQNWIMTYKEAVMIKTMNQARQMYNVWEDYEDYWIDYDVQYQAISDSMTKQGKIFAEMMAGH